MLCLDIQGPNQKEAAYLHTQGSSFFVVTLVLDFPSTYFQPLKQRQSFISCAISHLAFLLSKSLTASNTLKFIEMYCFFADQIFIPLVPPLITCIVAVGFLLRKLVCILGTACTQGKEGTPEETIPQKKTQTNLGTSANQDSYFNQ